MMTSAKIDTEILSVGVQRMSVFSEMSHKSLGRTKFQPYQSSDKHIVLQSDNEWKNHEADPGGGS